MSSSKKIPYGYCHCGCGQKTRIADRNHATMGYRRGEPVLYRVGHNSTRLASRNTWAKSPCGRWYSTNIRGSIFYVSSEDIDTVRAYTWHISKCGYAKTNVKGSTGKPRTISMAQLIMSPAKGLIVDHINRDKTDNRRDNLRVCTRAENVRNRTSNKRRSIPLGVRKTSLHRFRVSVQVDGKSNDIPGFLCPTEAAIFRDIMAMELHGEFAVLNFPELREVMAYASAES